MVTPARIAVQVDLVTTPPGLVRLDADSDHLIRLHAGASVRGMCHSQPLLYQSGDIDVFPAGISDSWEQHGISRSLAVRLPTTLVRRAAQDITRDPDRASLAVRCQFRDKQVEYICWALDAERRAGYPSGPLYSESLGVALAVRLLGRSGAQTRLRGGLTKAQLRRITSYVEEHLDRDLSLAELASVAGISVSHLKASFRRSMGVPVHRFVIQRRLERAKKLLLERRIRASEAALEAGFAHQSHMARWMRRLMGVTPSSLTAQERQRPQ